MSLLYEFSVYVSLYSDRNGLHEEKNILSENNSDYFI